MNRRSFILKTGTTGMAQVFINCFPKLKGLSPKVRYESHKRTKKNVNGNMDNLEMTNNGTYLGIYNKKNASTEIEKDLISKLGLEWLSKGDSVFLKVSSNSGNPHPAVTLPKAIDIIVKILKDAGAGEILIGDQAGVQHVRLTKTERKSSTKEILAKNGILNSIESTKSKLHCFDDFGWDSYYKPKLGFANHWGDELYIPDIIKKTDHIIYLPRLGSHCFSGYSSGLKNAVGFLRDDSRLSLHRDGENFHKRIAELSLIPDIQSKLRCVITIADKALLHFGPDMGKVHDLGGVILIASNNIVRHDYLTAAVLNRFNKSQASFFKFAPKFHFPSSMSWNNILVKGAWGKEERKKTSKIPAFTIDDVLQNHLSLSHYCKISNYHPSKINISVDMESDKDFKVYLNQFGNGIFNMV